MTVVERLVVGWLAVNAALIAALVVGYLWLVVSESVQRSRQSSRL